MLATARDLRRRRRRTRAATLLGAIAVAVVPLQAGGTPGAQDESSGWMSDGNAAYLTLGVGALDLANDPAEARYAQVGDIAALERDGRNASLDFGVFFVKAISMGLRYEYHSADYYTKVSGFFGPSRDVHYKTRVDEVLVDLRAWMPPRRGFLLGFAGGYSKGKMDGDADRWSNAGAAYQFYTGGQFAMGEGNTLLVVLRVGYALRDYGITEDPTYHPDDPIELDMSGWFVELNAGGIAKIRNDDELE